MNLPNSTSLSGENVAPAASRADTLHNGVRLLLAQAMQATSHAMNDAAARQQNGRLIAMSRIRSHSLPLLDYGLTGFAEPDGLALKPAREGRCAKENPQACGKGAAAFDLVGLACWLRRRFPRYTSVNVEAETGIAAASIENWLQYRSQPSVEYFSILVSTFGPSLLRAALRDDALWLEKAEAEALAALEPACRESQSRPISEPRSTRARRAASRTRSPHVFRNWSWQR